MTLLRRLWSSLMWVFTFTHRHKTEELKQRRKERKRKKTNSSEQFLPFAHINVGPPHFFHVSYKPQNTPTPNVGPTPPPPSARTPVPLSRQVLRVGSTHTLTRAAELAILFLTTASTVPPASFSGKTCSMNLFVSLLVPVCLYSRMSSLRLAPAPSNHEHRCDKSEVGSWQQEKEAE